MFLDAHIIKHFSELFVVSVSKVTVLFAGQPIPKSPFEVNVDKALGDASKVTVKGPGVEPVGNVANKPTYFDIYTAGQRNHKDSNLKFNHRMIFLDKNTKKAGLESRTAKPLLNLKKKVRLFSFWTNEKIKSFLLQIKSWLKNH